MQLFKMGVIDLTPFIRVPSYKINKIPEYEEWTDSNYTLHRDVVRERLQGSFTLRFTTVEEYESFINYIKSNIKTDGSLYVSAYAHNKREVISTNVFMDFDPQDNLPILGRSDDDGFEVTITER